MYDFIQAIERNVSRLRLLHTPKRAAKVQILFVRFIVFVKLLKKSQKGNRYVGEKAYLCRSKKQS